MRGYADARNAVAGQPAAVLCAAQRGFKAHVRAGALTQLAAD